MAAYAIRFSKEAVKDVNKLPPKQRQKLKEILTRRIAHDPYQGKHLIGDLAGLYSIRLNYKDRIVYSVDEGTKCVYVHRARTHYGD